MILNLTQDLPSPDDNDTKGREFEKFINDLSLNVCEEPALLAYQGVSTDGSSYVTAKQLNHSINLIEHGVNSDYAHIAEDQLGCALDDYQYEKSLKELDCIFARGGYSFSANSILYKGIRNSVPFYRLLDLKSCKAKDEVVFYGFLSTSVSRKKALDFIGSDGVLLVISGLENSHGIIPKNSTVIYSPTSNNPEQEILLNRGTKILVHNCSKNSDGVIEVECKVIK